MSTQDAYAKYGYDQNPIHFGERPAILVVDFQKGFIDPKYPTGGSALVESAVQSTAPLLKLAREKEIPVAQCVTVFHPNHRDLPHWKIGVLEDCVFGSEAAEIDERLYHPDDIFLPKNAPSIFFGTRLASMLIRQGVDTTIVTGIVTSGCIRASVIDSCSYGFRTIVPRECVGDLDEQPHLDNLRDIQRRYAEVVPLATVMDYLTTSLGQAA